MMLDVGLEKARDVFTADHHGIDHLKAGVGEQFRVRGNFTVVQVVNIGCDEAMNFALCDEAV